MSTDNDVRLIQPGTFDNQPTAVLRDGAKALLAKAVEAEVAAFLARHADLKTEDGHRRVVRHGHIACARIPRALRAWWRSCVSDRAFHER